MFIPLLYNNCLNNNEHKVNGSYGRRHTYYDIKSTIIELKSQNKNYNCIGNNVAVT